MVGLCHCHFDSDMVIHSDGMSMVPSGSNGSSNNEVNAPVVRPVVSFAGFPGTLRLENIMKVIYTVYSRV